MNYIRLFTTFFIVISSTAGFTQERPALWTLRECIDYARKNNIQVQSSRINNQTGVVNLLESKAQLFPSLVFSSTQGWSHQKTQDTGNKFTSRSAYTGSYSLNAGMTLYNGSKLTRSVKKQKIAAEALEYETSVAENDIEISVTEDYLQILYANEALKTNRQTLETSKAQLDRAEELYKAGSIAVSDRSQIRAQYSNDQYQVTLAENTLALAKLQLKQLLELELDESFEIHFPELSDADVLTLIPSLKEVYETALKVMPEMKSSKLKVDAAYLDEKIAAADRLPSITFNASVGTDHDSDSDYSFRKQLNNRLNENIGINISIPIAQNRQVKSAVEKAKLQTETVQLEEINTRKTLLKTIETLYQNAISAQSRYIAATNSVKSASESYRLVQAQFDAGMKNTVELLTEKNNFLSAIQEQIQAKYDAILSIKLLNFYQNQPIEL